MTAVEETCIKCGRKFLRGIFPQRVCDLCSKPVSYILKKDNKEIKYTKIRPFFFRDSHAAWEIPTTFIKLRDRLLEQKRNQNR